MADVKYDEAVLQKSVNRLYSQANSLVASVVVLAALIGGIAGYLAALFASTQGVDVSAGAWAVFGALLTGAFGYPVGESRAFAIRVQAQTMLVQMQIERNTRPKPDEGHDQESDPVSTST